MTSPSQSCTSSSEKEGNEFPIDNSFPILIHEDNNQSPFTERISSVDKIKELNYANRQENTKEFGESTTNLNPSHVEQTDTHGNEMRQPLTHESQSVDESSSPQIKTSTDPVFGTNHTSNKQHASTVVGRDLFEVTEMRAQLSAAQTGDRLSNHVWSCCADSWLKPADVTEEIPDEVSTATQNILHVLHQENDSTTLTQRGVYGLETKNRLVNRLHEEVDLFMMSPECTPALKHLDALKDQLSFHYFRITQHVMSFADSRLRTIPIGAPPGQALCITTWAQCVGYELICELLDSLVKEIETLRSDCIQSSQVISSYGDSLMPNESIGSNNGIGVSHSFNSRNDASSLQRKSSGDSFQRMPSPREASNTLENIGTYNDMKRGAMDMCDRSRSGSMGSNDMDSPRSDTEVSRKKSRCGSALPPSARTFLDQWLSSHWHDPYPTPDEKAELAYHCHITVDQVNHWFINARVRRWRPTMEKAASRAKTSGTNNAFAALVKDCGEENPFAKFLGPIGTGGATRGRPRRDSGQEVRYQKNHRFERRV